MGGQNDKVHLKNIKLFRIIPKKKKNSLIFFKNFGGAKAPLGLADHSPLLNHMSENPFRERWDNCIEDHLILEMLMLEL